MRHIMLMQKITRQGEVIQSLNLHLFDTTDGISGRRHVSVWSCVHA